MDIIVSNYAWVARSDLTDLQVAAIKRVLTLIPQQMADYAKEDPEPVYLYAEHEGLFGMAREWFLNNRQQFHNIKYVVSEGDKSQWTDLKFTGALRDYQVDPIQKIIDHYQSGGLGGWIVAAPGTGKTTMSLDIVAKLQIPTLVVVNKDFLMGQWIERIKQFLPDAKIGQVQGNICDFEGKHIVMAMIHSLAQRKYPDALYTWPGLIIFDEGHHIGAGTFSTTIAQFSARRLGITATLRRKDGMEDVFGWQIGPVITRVEASRLPVKIKRVYTDFNLYKSDKFDPGKIKKPTLLRFLCASKKRNMKICELIIEAVKAGRKIIVVSERVNHLEILREMLKEMWKGPSPCPTSGFYIGGMEEEEHEATNDCQVIFATSQMCLAGDSTIIDACTGTPIKLKDLPSGGGKETLSYNENKGVMENVAITSVRQTGIQPVNRIHYGFQSDDYIDATDSHLFYTQRGWVEAAELTTSDWFASPKKQVSSTPPQSGYTPEQAELLGYIIGDGCVSRIKYGLASFITTDPVLRDRVAALLDPMQMELHAVTEKNYRIYGKERAKGRAKKTPFRQLIEKADLAGCRAWEKHIHTDLLHAPEEVIIRLLAGLWCTDGHISARKRQYQAIFYSSSFTLATQVRYLLARLGIPSFLRGYPATSTKRAGYSVYVGGKIHVGTFAKIIGPHLVGKRQSALNTRMNTPSQSARERIQYGTGDRVPMEIWKKALDTWKAKGRLLKDVYKVRTSAPVSELQRIVDTTKDPNLEAWLNSPLYWEPIRRIEQMPAVPVYDVAMQRNGNFVCNGILTHNCAEGYDNPPLDTLFLVTPMSDVEQVLGRIRREHPCKKDPIVVDIRDDLVSICKRAGARRDEFYSTC